MKKAAEVVEPLSPGWGRGLVPLLIVVVTMMVYARSLDNGFVNWDDTEYILTNAHLQEATIQEHFVEKPEVMGNYHPLTMLTLAWSHQQAFNARTKKLDARIFHTADLVLHILSALLVYLLLFHLVGNAWVAGITALLFAVHPMHVESVAWASERKDVLYTFFFFAALICYTLHLRSKRQWWLLGTLLLFAASLLSKAMAVSLVPVLFLIDLHQQRKWNWHVLLEKLPFIALAVWAGLKAIASQGAFESVQDLDLYPLWQRTLFACYGFSMYVVKFFVPFGLSAFHGYPPPASPPTWIFIGAAVFMVLIAFVLWRARRNRDLVFGMGFFLFTVALVLQLLPVGGAVMAERYTYIPYVGLGFAVMSLLWKWAEHSAPRRRMATIGAGVFVLVMAVMARERAAVWKDGVSLWTDAMQKDDGQPKTLNNFGVALTLAGRHEEALRLLDRAVALKVDYGDAFYNRGLVNYNLGRKEAAIADYTNAIKYRPSLAEAWHNRAGTLYTIGRPQEALVDALKAKELGYAVDPKFIEALQQQTGSTGASVVP